MPRHPLFIAVFAASSAFLFPACEPTHAPDAPVSQAAARVPLFELHSNPWVNLHHLLYAKGLKEKGHPTRAGGGGEGADGLENVQSGALPEAESAPWNAAVAFYASAFAEHDLTFDDELVTINNALSANEGAADLRASGLSPELVQHLERTMPIYKAHFWAEHDRANRAWIAKVQPNVDRFGRDLSRDFERAYRVKWPAQPFRVDVSCYASWAGAYTTMNPTTHLTIASIDPRNEEPAGFETLFHETSHGIIRPVRDALDKELSRQRKSAGSLWHALLFFTTGELVKRRFPGYVPFAIQYGLYDKGEWHTYLPILEQHWLPWIEGRIDHDTAIRDVVSAL